MSGAGLAVAMSLAMDQIFCFAPSISPPIEPVVSRTKQTSILGLGFFLAASLAKVVGENIRPATKTEMSIATLTSALSQPMEEGETRADFWKGRAAGFAESSFATSETFFAVLSPIGWEK